MIVLDSNIWIAYLLEEDSTHDRAVEIFNNIKFEDILLTEYVLLEVSSLLKQIGGYGVAKYFLNLAVESKVHFLKSEKFYGDTLLLFQSLVGNKLSFVDISLVVLSKRYEVKTFDKALKKMINII